MATITVRVTSDEKADIELRAGRAGLDTSAFIRRALDLERDTPDMGARIDAHEQRLSRLERMAGLD